MYKCISIQIYLELDRITVVIWRLKWLTVCIQRLPTCIGIFSLTEFFNHFYENHFISSWTVVLLLCVVKDAHPVFLTSSVHIGFCRLLLCGCCCYTNKRFYNVQSMVKVNMVKDIRLLDNRPLADIRPGHLPQFAPLRQSACPPFNFSCT